MTAELGDRGQRESNEVRTSPPATIWHVVVGGRVYGPVDGPTIRHWAVEGRLQPGWQVCARTGDAWLSPSAVPELAEVETLPPPPPRVAGLTAPTEAELSPPPIGEVITDGWELWKRNVLWGIGLFLGQLLLRVLVAALPALALLIVPTGAWPEEPFDARWLLVAPAVIIHAMLSLPIGLGVVTCCIDTARRGEGAYASLFSGFRQWSSMFLLQAAWMLAAQLPGVGYAMILAMPVYFALMWTMADRQRGIIDAIEQVTKLLSGRYWWVFLTIVLAALIGAAGIFALGAGLLLSVPLSMLITAVVYLDCSRRLGWAESDRQPPTGGRLALEVVPMVVLTLLLLGGVIAVYVFVF